MTNGGLGEPARQLLPLEPVSYNGGWVSFRLKVDPQQQNYFTVKLWGSDKGAQLGRLILYLDGQHAIFTIVPLEFAESVVAQNEFAYFGAFLGKLGLPAEGFTCCLRRCRERNIAVGA